MGESGGPVQGPQPPPPIESMKPGIGTKLGWKLVSTTPEGSMNSLAPPPLSETPSGRVPARSKPTCSSPPGGTGSLGVIT